jgi:hypothetical protein
VILPDALELALVALQQFPVVVGSILRADLILLCSREMRLFELLVTVDDKVAEDGHTLGDRLLLELCVFGVIIEQLAKTDLEIHRLVIRSR